LLLINSAYLKILYLLSDEPPDEVSSKLLKLDENGISSQPQTELPTITENLQENMTQAVISSAPINDKKTRVNTNTKRNNEKLFRKNNEFNKNNNQTNKTNNLGISNSRLTLLKKLLARSIQNEHNAIFQCIKFIANNNFFDK
jgi:L-lactate utilization protein LutC